MPLSSHPQQPHNVATIRQGLSDNVHQMALTQKSPTTAAANSATPQQQPPEQKLDLPPPQTFDILPALHELLARVYNSSSMSADTLEPSPVSDEDAADVGALYADLAPLEPKDLPNENLQIKARIRRAQKELEKLPDMNRSIADQEEEIVELEKRIVKQREMKKMLDSRLRDMGSNLG